MGPSRWVPPKRFFGSDELFSMMFQALMPYAERLDVQLQVGKVSGTKGLSWEGLVWWSPKMSCWWCVMTILEFCLVVRDWDSEVFIFRLESPAILFMNCGKPEMQTDSTTNSGKGSFPLVLYRNSAGQQPNLLYIYREKKEGILRRKVMVPSRLVDVTPPSSWMSWDVLDSKWWPRLVIRISYVS